MKSIFSTIAISMLIMGASADRAPTSAEEAVPTPSDEKAHAEEAHAEEAHPTTSDEEAHAEEAHPTPSVEEAPPSVEEDHSDRLKFMKGIFD